MINQRFQIYLNHARLILGPAAAADQIRQLAEQTLKEFGRAIREQLKLLLDLSGFTSRLYQLAGAENLRQAVTDVGRAVIALPRLSYYAIGIGLLAKILPERTTALVVTNRDRWYKLYRYQWLTVSDVVAFSQSLRRDPNRRRIRIAVLDMTNRTTVQLLNRWLAGAGKDERRLVILGADRPDLSVDGTTETVRFLDQPARLPGGPVTLASLAKAALVPGYVARDGESFTVGLAEPLAVGPDLTETIKQQTLQQLADFFTTTIRRYPSQWPVYRRDIFLEKF